MSMNDPVLNILLTCFNNVVADTETRSSEKNRKLKIILSSILLQN